LVEILLSEKEELVDLIEQYEASMSNATSLRVRIREIVKDEKCNDENLKEKVMGRLSDATEEFKTFIDQED
jgi:hypothetical protein